MKTFGFELYHSKHNNKLHEQINAAELIYNNHCIALHKHKRYYRLYKVKIDFKNISLSSKGTKKLAYICEIGSQSVKEITDRSEHGYKLFRRNRENKHRKLQLHSLLNPNSIVNTKNHE